MFPRLGYFKCIRYNPNRKLNYPFRYLFRRQRTFKGDGLEALRKGDNKKALELLQISLKQQKGDVREQRDTLKLLCKLYFKEKSFSKCLETGRKLKASLPKENHEENNSLRVCLTLVNVKIL